MPATELVRSKACDLGLDIKRLDVLENLLRRYIAEDLRQAIVVKITRKGVPVFEGCYGTNTKPYGVKLDTIFSVASITKPVVSALLFILQEDGLVDLCEPVYHYLPEFKEGGREKIMPWQLLTHSSGLKDEDSYVDFGEYAAKEFRMLPPEENCPPEEWDEFHRNFTIKMGMDPDAPPSDRMNDPSYVLSLKKPLKHEPRSHMTYCNYGCQLLKWIVDAVTKEPIDAFAKRRLFGPLGMADTYWNVPEAKWDRILGRGEKCEGYPFINSNRYYKNESGAGGLKTTVNDITNLGRMILGKGTFDNKKILGKRSILEMTRNHNGDVSTGADNIYAAWGLGWNIRCDKKDDTGLLRSANCIDHGGWAGTKFVIDPEEELTAAIFTAEYRQDEKNPHVSIYGKIMNVLYSALG